MREFEYVRPRALGACAVAAVLLWAGCGVGGDSPDSTPVAQETTIADEPTEPTEPTEPVDPWTLPLDERPPLFDACAEIPQELAEEVGIAEPGVRPEYVENRPQALIGCAWDSDSYFFGVSGTWKSEHEYELDPTWTFESDQDFTSQRGVILRGRGGPNSCAAALFTERGSVFVSLQMKFEGGIEAYNHRGEECPQLVRIVNSISGHLPRGV